MDEISDAQIRAYAYVFANVYKTEREQGSYSDEAKRIAKEATDYFRTWEFQINETP